MSVLKKVASGVGWGSLSIIIITLFQLFFMGVMARLLDPVDFGLIAIANVSLRFYSYFSQVGIAPALIQKKTLQDGDINAALSLSLSISSIFCVLAFLAAPLTETFFGLKGLAPVMQVLALNFIIFGFSSISQALLRRKSKFKALSIIEIISYVLGYGTTGLIAAYMGAGVWALVIAFMTQSLLSSLLSYLVIRYPIRFKHSRTQRRSLISYGGRYSIIGFIEFLTANIVPLLIGKLLGAAPAGFYNRAFLIAHLPVQQPANVLTKTLFPIMSKMNDQKEKQLISLQLSSLLVGCYAFAVSMGLYNAADNIIIVLLGNKWIASIPMLKILSLSIAPLYIAHTVGGTLDTMAELRLKLRIQIAVFLWLVLPLIWVVPSLDIEKIAIVVVISAYIRLFLMYGAAFHLLNISAKEMTLMILTFISVAAITALFSYGIPRLFTLTDIPILSLFIDVAAGAVGLVISLLFSRYFLRKLHSIIYLKKQLPLFNKIMEM